MQFSPVCVCERERACVYVCERPSHSTPLHHLAHPHLPCVLQVQELNGELRRLQRDSQERMQSALAEQRRRLTEQGDEARWAVAMTWEWGGAVMFGVLSIADGRAQSRKPWTD